MIQPLIILDENYTGKKIKRAIFCGASLRKNFHVKSTFLDFQLKNKAILLGTFYL